KQQHRQIKKADNLFNTGMNPGFISFSTRPATAKKTNQTKETRMQAAVNPIFSAPAYCSELAPITPTVSMMACGLSRETEPANITCSRGEIAAVSRDSPGASPRLRQV